MCLSLEQGRAWIVISIRYTEPTAQELVLVCAYVLQNLNGDLHI